MSLAEREYMKQVDKVILSASPEDLKRIQEIDIQTQLDGTTIYDSLANSPKIQLQNLPSKPKSFGRNKKH